MVSAVLSVPKKGRGMKKELLTVKELAAELRMSQKSIQRAYRKGEIPVQWLGRMARFNLAKVQRAMEWWAKAILNKSVYKGGSDSFEPRENTGARKQYGIN